MSITNTQLIKDAMVLAGILDEVQSPSAEQGDSTLRMQNEMLSEWAVDGIELNYYPQTSLSDTTPIPDSTIAAVKYNMAVRLAGEYGTFMSQESVAMATRTFDRLVRITLDDEIADVSHLPGAGHGGFDIQTG